VFFITEFDCISDMLILEIAKSVVGVDIWGQEVEPSLWENLELASVVGGIKVRLGNVIIF